MGKKSRVKIEEEFFKRQYLRYRKILRDPEFKSLWESLNNINQKLKSSPTDVELWCEKESIEEQLRNKHSFAIPPVEHSAWVTLLEEEKKGLEIPINPAKPLTEKEFEDLYVKGSLPIFLDMDIVTPLPIKEPKLVRANESPTIKGKKEPSSERRTWSKIDYTGFLEDDRYLTVKIDTWNKYTDVEAAIKEVWDSLRERGVISFESRVHLTTDEERIRVRELRDQGMSEKQIARYLWPKEYDEEENRITEIEDLENKKAILRDNYIRKLLNQGEKFPEAQKKARKKYPPKKLPVNCLIKKVSRLLYKIPE